MIRWRPLFVLTLAVAALPACYDAPSRLNSPPQGDSPRPHPMQEQYTYMVDNAMLADMAIADIHFVPHSPEINSLGERRLDRYADLLELYGGTLHYDAGISDETLIRERMDRVRNFLKVAGVDANRIEVEEGMAGGRGMNGNEAILIRISSMTPPENANSTAGQNDFTAN